MKLNGEVVIVTGGAGMLGSQYMEAIEEIGGFPISLDIAHGTSLFISNGDYALMKCDITKEEEINKSLELIKDEIKRPIYGLINNAAIDPKFDNSAGNAQKPRFEHYSRDVWDKEIAVGLTGAFLCSKVFGSEMAKNFKGSIINVSSVLGLVAPNQELYKKTGVKDDYQPVKPVTYSVIKHGIIGLTRYTATYWANKGIRCNAICPGGVYNNHPDKFVHKLSKYIPLGRMAEKGEYNELVKFLLTDASSFMTGSILACDGGQTVW